MHFIVLPAFERYKIRLMRKTNLFRSASIFSGWSTFLKHSQPNNLVLFNVVASMSKAWKFQVTLTFMKEWGGRGRERKTNYIGKPDLRQNFINDRDVISLSEPLKAFFSGPTEALLLSKRYLYQELSEKFRNNFHFLFTWKVLQWRKT